MKAINILIVDERGNTSPQYCEQLCRSGYSTPSSDGTYAHITIATSGDNAVGLLKRSKLKKYAPFDLVICPFVIFLGSSTVELLEAAQEDGIIVPVIVLIDLNADQDYSDKKVLAVSGRNLYANNVCYMDVGHMCRLGAAIKHLLGQKVP
ncbi:MAG: hypothetical protein QG621_211 [Patescibacteria group bacterium]|nr:hypothetical protein [Patescibacteria group bacterium]